MPLMWEAGSRGPGGQQGDSRLIGAPRVASPFVSADFEGSVADALNDLHREPRRRHPLEGVQADDLSGAHRILLAPKHATWRASAHERPMRAWRAASGPPIAIHD